MSPNVPPAWKDAWGDSPAGGEHLDDVTLAELADDVLTSEARQLAEDHLADCADCRALALEVSAAVGETAALEGRAAETAPAPERLAASRWRRWLPLAAGLLLAFAGWWHFQSPPAPPAIPEARLAAQVDFSAGRPTGALVELALAGRWPPLPGLDDLPPPAMATVRRGVGLSGGSAGIEPPVAWSPRWGSVASTRPDLRWRFTGGPSEGEAPESEVGGLRWDFEILVVNDQDDLVLREMVAAEPSAEGLLRAAWPATAPELSPGARYAWKINARRDEVVHGSPFVPFRVLTPEERSSLDLGGDLAEGVGDEVALSLRRAAAGLYDEALAGLRAADLDDPLRRDLMAAVEARKRLPPEVTSESAQEAPP